MGKNECKCPWCGQIINKRNTHHIRACRLKYLENMSEEDKEKYLDLYVNKEISIYHMSEILNLPYNQIKLILQALGIKLRTIKEACNTSERKRRHEETMMKHYGVRHNFCKECSSRKKWEKRLLEEEGITNVFQRVDVKKKIKETNLKKYGAEGVYYNYVKGSTLEYWIEKLGEEEGIKRYQEIIWGKTHGLNYYIEKYGEEEGEKRYGQYMENVANAMSNVKHWDGLNKKAYKILKKNNIEFIPEFKLIKEDKIHYYRYDLKIGNLLIELNGIYWHCSPKKYRPHDLVHFPNGKIILAKDKWGEDKEKQERAKQLGYAVEVIWEDEFNENKLLEIIKNHNYGMC